MPRSPRKESRSGSKSRASSKKAAKTPKSPSPSKSRKTPKKPKHKMDFSEGENVMARWPGTTLFFKARVTFVRDDDNEYDVQFEDGTVYTLKAKDVKDISLKDLATSSSAKKTTPGRRSRSRGRSPGRPKGSTKAKTSTPKDSASRSTSRSRRSARNVTPAVKAPRPDVTPVRTSARLAASKVDLSADEDEHRGRKAIPNPVHSKKSWMFFLPHDLNLEWVQALFYLVLGPLILITLHTLSRDGIYGIHSFAMPNFRLDWKEYYDRQALWAVFGFAFLVRILSFMPLGTRMRTSQGPEVRLNGFISLLIILGAVAAMAYRKIDLSFVTKNYWHLMLSSIALTKFVSVFAFIWARWGKRSHINPRGNTGNIIVDFYYGRELNPFFAGGDLKLLTFRVSMIGLALINVLLVWDSIVVHRVVNYAILVTALFQVVYAADAMFFEQYYFFSHDSMNKGFGFSIVSLYCSFPFLATLITRYMIDKNPTLTTSQLMIICGVYVIGYLVFRISESQRCEFSKNPNNASMRKLATVSTIAGKKILVGGFWGLVKHPNLLGEILTRWAWVLPAVSAAGSTDFLVYCLPILTTLSLVTICNNENKRNRRKYGHAWEQYSEKVPYNLIPYVY